jgi:hypothetical protein
MTYPDLWRGNPVRRTVSFCAAGLTFEEYFLFWTVKWLLRTVCLTQNMQWDLYGARRTEMLHAAIWISTALREPCMWHILNRSNYGWRAKGWMGNLHTHMHVIPRTKFFFVWQYSNNQLREPDSVTQWIHMANPVTCAILNQLDIVSEI